MFRGRKSAGMSDTKKAIVTSKKAVDRRDDRPLSDVTTGI